MGYQNHALKNMRQSVINHFFSKTLMFSKRFIRRSLSMISLCVTIILVSHCSSCSKEKDFITEHEFDNFSLFHNTHVFIRGKDVTDNTIVMIHAPALVRDTSCCGLYVVTFDENNHLSNTKWTLTSATTDADTTMLQHIAKQFLNYNVQRLDVDSIGNVFVYFYDVETLSIVKVVGENKTTRLLKNKGLRHIQGEWYKPQR